MHLSFAYFRHLHHFYWRTLYWKAAPLIPEQKSYKTAFPTIDRGVAVSQAASILLVSKFLS